MVPQPVKGSILRTFATIAVVLGGLALILVSAVVTITGVLLILGGVMTPMGPPDARIPTVPQGIVVALVGVGLGLLGLAAIFRGPRLISRSGSPPNSN